MRKVWICDRFSLITALSGESRRCGVVTNPLGLLIQRATPRRSCVREISVDIRQFGPELVMT